MDIFVVMDQHILGRGVFGIFSTIEKAEEFMNGYTVETGQLCIINQMSIIGERISPRVFGGYIYDSFYDTHVLDGIYADPLDARDGINPGGIVVRYVIDYPDEKELLHNT